MNVLCVGDVVGNDGCAFLRKHLSSIKRMKGVDAVIVNGENSAESNGITPDSADYLLSSGADCITTGNHCFQRREIYETYDSGLPILRPANFPSIAPGVGYGFIDLGRARILVVNLIGNVAMNEPLACPFEAADRILEEHKERFVVVDFHAEATAEKRALAAYLDGRVSAFFGTHTHVQTADEQILPNGTGFITDVGMTGVINSCIGVKVELAISRMRSHMPTRLELASGPCMLNAVLFELDDRTGKTVSVERLIIK